MLLQCSTFPHQSESEHDRKSSGKCRPWSLTSNNKAFCLLSIRSRPSRFNLCHGSWFGVFRARPSTQILKQQSGRSALMKFSNPTTCPNVRVDSASKSFSKNVSCCAPGVATPFAQSSHFFTTVLAHDAPVIESFCRSRYCPSLSCLISSFPESTTDFQLVFTCISSLRASFVRNTTS